MKMTEFGLREVNQPNIWQLFCKKKTHENEMK